MTLLTVLLTVFSVLLTENSVNAQGPSAQFQTAQFQVYRLRYADPVEVRRMLNELLGTAADEVRIVVDRERSEILVAGSAKVQILSSQLVQELDQPPAAAARVKPGMDSEASVALPPQVIRTYPCEVSRIENSLRTLRSVVSDDARLSVDSTGRRIVLMATETEHQKAELALRAAVLMQSAPQPFGSDLPPTGSLRERYQFRHVSSQQCRTTLQQLLGQRFWELGNNRFSYSAGSNRHIVITFEDASGCHLDGPRDLVQQFRSLLETLDDSQDQQKSETVRIVPVSSVNADVLQRAIQLWKKSQADPGVRGENIDSIPAPFDEQGRLDQSRSAFPLIRSVGFVQQAGEPAIPITPGVNSSRTEPGDPGSPDQNNLLRRPAPDVEVNPLPDLDVLILRGRDPDVQELIRIIQEIERLSEETAPAIDIVYLQHVQGEALNLLMTNVLQDLVGPLQGRVTITPLVKPNALLLIGWGEAVEAAKKLIARLDETVPAATQMKLFPLVNAPAAEVETTVREFLSGRGGLGPDVTITANPRTNTVIVNASPRDMQEVTRLIQQLDSGISKSVNQARIIRLKNSLAADVSQTINSAIQAARGGVGGQRSAALEMLLVGPDGKSVAASGLLDDVRLTPDARTNRIFVTGPAGSLSLVEQLIQSLDESPAASAQIKVFQIGNGDASDLVQVLRSLFPEQAAVSTVPQLPTSSEETALVPVRFSVDVRTNSIIATGAAGDLRIIEALLLRLDESDSQERINQVYRLKNSPALDVANAVNNFLRSERIVAQAAPGRQNPFTQIESEVVVVPEPVGNALIISATPRYFEQILELVEGLDAQPPQVMIQVILAEVELNNLHEFGVELGLQDSLLFDRSLLGTLLQPGFDFNNRPLGNANTPESLASRGNVGGQALSHFSLNRISDDADFGGLVLSASSENVSVLLRALNRTRNMEILSRPQIMTLDNQPAFIQVGQRVPRIVGTSINQVGQVNSVELENVGLILGVTPRISPEGMVVMEIDAEKSEVGPEAEGIPVSVSADGSVVRSPRVNITTAQTTVGAASGQTVVIGGLITTSNTTITRRVPWLSDVPLVGNLFRYDGSACIRKELLIILTPHVIRGRSEAEYMKQVEMARMSWISSDVFSWLNTDTCITGQLDSQGIPTIYPDHNPGLPAWNSSAGGVQSSYKSDAVPHLESSMAMDVTDLRSIDSAGTDTAPVDPAEMPSEFEYEGDGIRPQSYQKRLKSRNNVPTDEGGESNASPAQKSVSMEKVKSSKTADSKPDRSASKSDSKLRSAWPWK